VSERVRRVRLNVGACSAKFGYSREVFGVVGLVSGRVRRGFLSVETCSARSV